MAPDEWPAYLAMIEEARMEYEGRLEVKVGVECDFLPSLVEYWREWLPTQQLSHVLGSVHPQVADYRALYWTGDALAYQKTYFKHLADAAETGLFDTLSHPDLVKNTTPPEWDVKRLMPHINRQLDRIQKTGVAMELNTSGTLKRIPEMNPAPAILREIAARDIPIVLGADAHVPERVADRFEEALGLLASCGFSHVSFFVDRKRREVSIETARCSLQKAQLALFG